MEETEDMEMDVESTTSENSIGFVSNLLTTWRSEEDEVKETYPGRCTLRSESCHLFSQDSLTLKDFNSSGVQNELFNLSKPELWEAICQYKLKHSYSSESVLHSVCWYLFFLTSVHRDETIVHFSSKTLQLIKEDWYPSADNIFLVFINWGIKSEFIDLQAIDSSGTIPLNFTDKLPPGPRIELHNLKKFLEIVHSVATPVAQNTLDEKFNKLLQLLVLLSLDDGFPRNKGLWSCFSRCIEALINALPDDQWNSDKVQSICQALHRQGKEHFHNQKEVCNRMLTFIPRGNEVALALAYATLNELLAIETKIEPLVNLSNVRVFDIVSHYGSVHQLRFYPLCIVTELVKMCVVKEDFGNALPVEYLENMRKWLNRLKRPTICGSLDHMKLLTQIDMSLSLWNAMIVNKEELAIQHQMSEI